MLKSGRQDSNLRSPAPKAGALATTLRPVVPATVYGQKFPDAQSAIHAGGFASCCAVAAHFRARRRTCSPGCAGRRLAGLNENPRLAGRGSLIFGGGDGNRTRVVSLEDWSFTIKLRPRVAGGGDRLSPEQLRNTINDFAGFANRAAPRPGPGPAWTLLAPSRSFGGRSCSARGVPAGQEAVVNIGCLSTGLLA